MKKKFQFAVAAACLLGAATVSAQTVLRASHQFPGGQGDPLALLGVTAVFVVVVGVCCLVSAALGRRVSSAATLRSVQE